MSELLSQQEINSLLSGVENNATESEGGSPRPEMIPFDFQLPHRLTKRQLQMIHSLHDRFAETFSSYLVARLQTTATMSVVSVRQIFYSDYVASSSTPSCYYVFRLDTLNSMAVMEFSPQLVLTMIARLLGSRAEETTQPRQITKIEQNIIKNLVLRAIADLEKAWAKIMDCPFKYERYESEGDLVQVAPGSEIVLVVSFEVTTDDQKHLMNVCFPTFVLEGILSQMDTEKSESTTPNTGSSEWTQQMLERIETTRIPITCLLGETTLTLGQLIDLEPGDVLLTTTPITGELRIMLDGHDRIKGRPGIFNGKKAVKITHIMDTEDNHG